MAFCDGAWCHLQFPKFRNVKTGEAVAVFAEGTWHFAPPTVGNAQEDHAQTWDVRAPMPGVIADVFVTPGQAVVKRGCHYRSLSHENAACHAGKTRSVH